ncbi:MAG: metallophosphoesterase [Myxococcaceae bacterium]|nr:metallophosphoesterase [Myxococcaceae bacterium]
MLALGMSEFWRITTALLTVLAVTGALALYLVMRAGWAFSLSRRVRNGFGAALLLGLLAAGVSRTLDRSHAELAERLGELGGVVMLGIVISATLLLPVELGLWLTRFLRRSSTRRDDAKAGVKSAPSALAKPPELAARPAPERPERREFIAQAAAGGALAFGFGAGLYGTWVGRRDYTIETVPIRLAKLPRALDGLTIVQLSDIHIGTFVNERELRAALELVRGAKPDLVVLTGDLLDHDAAYAPMLGRFARSLGGLARYGVHAIPGNHDHYAGAGAMMDALRDAGSQVLLNRHVQIGQGKAAIVLAGLDDVAGPRFEGPGPRLDLAFRGAPAELARVLLSHNPAYFPTSRGEADLTLSGHTHGGQISLFINPAELMLRHGLVRGHYTVDDSQLYVNRGFGTAGPPARIGSPPEITRLVLHV